MPRYIVTVKHLAGRWDHWPRYMTAESPEAIEQQLIADGFDKRYWGFEIHAYSVNGEDF